MKRRTDCCFGCCCCRFSYRNDKNIHRKFHKKYFQRVVVVFCARSFVLNLIFQWHSYGWTALRLLSLSSSSSPSSLFLVFIYIVFFHQFNNVGFFFRFITSKNQNQHNLHFHFSCWAGIFYELIFMRWFFGHPKMAFFLLIFGFLHNSNDENHCFAFSVFSRLVEFPQLFSFQFSIRYIQFTVIFFDLY